MVLPRRLPFRLACPGTVRVNAWVIKGGTAVQPTSSQALRALALSLAVVLTVVPPASADEPVFVIPEPAILPSALAPVVTYIGPAAIGLTAMAIAPSLKPDAALLIGSAGLGLGHVYAGDPFRALAVSAASPVVLGGSLLLGEGLGRLAGPDSGSALLIALTTAIGGWGIFGGWSMIDAYQTAERVKTERARAKAAVSLPQEPGVDFDRQPHLP